MKKRLLLVFICISLLFLAACGGVKYEVHEFAESVGYLVKEKDHPKDDFYHFIRVRENEGKPYQIDVYHSKTNDVVEVKLFIDGKSSSDYLDDSREDSYVYEVELPTEYKTVKIETKQENGKKTSSTFYIQKILKAVEDYQEANE